MKADAFNRCQKCPADCVCEGKTEPGGENCELFQRRLKGIAKELERMVNEKNNPDRQAE